MAASGLVGLVPQPDPADLFATTAGAVSNRVLPGSPPGAPGALYLYQTWPAAPAYNPGVTGVPSISAQPGGFAFNRAYFYSGVSVPVTFMRNVGFAARLYNPETSRIIISAEPLNPSGTPTAGVVPNAANPSFGPARFSLSCSNYTDSSTTTTGPYALSRQYQNLLQLAAEGPFVSWQPAGAVAPVLAQYPPTPLFTSEDQFYPMLFLNSPYQSISLQSPPIPAVVGAAPGALLWWWCYVGTANGSSITGQRSPQLCATAWSGPAGAAFIPSPDNIPTLVPTWAPAGAAPTPLLPIPTLSPNSSIVVNRGITGANAPGVTAANFSVSTSTVTPVYVPNSYPPFDSVNTFAAVIRVEICLNGPLAAALLVNAFKVNVTILNEGNTYNNIPVAGP